MKESESGYIDIRVRFLGTLADDVGVREIKLRIDHENSTVRDLLELLRIKLPNFRKAESRLPMIWVFVNDKQAYLQ